MLTEIHGRLSYQYAPYGIPVVELGIGNIKFPEALILTTLPCFAAIRRDEFDSLETNGAIRNASNIEKQLHIGAGYIDRFGYTNMWVIGTEESIVPAKLYRNVTVARSNVDRSSNAGVCLGFPFISDFDIAEFWEVWKGSGRCILRFNNLEMHSELFDERPDEKSGFYGLRDGAVSDITDFLE